MPPIPAAITRAEARAADARAEALLGLSTGVLMENAGRQLASVTLSEARRYGIPGAAIRAGRGSNGGDGLVAARHLRLRGFPVRVVLVAPAGSFAADSDSGRNLRAAKGLGIPVREALTGAVLESVLGPREGPLVLVDAILGTLGSMDPCGAPWRASCAGWEPRGGRSWRPTSPRASTPTRGGSGDPSPPA